MQRREFLAAAIAGAATAALPRAAFAQTAPSLAMRPLRGRLSLVTGAGANVVAGAEPDGLLLVDGGRREHAAALLDFVSRETGQSRVGALVNTHWHPDQTGLNETLGGQGTRIVAHENTRLWLGIDIEEADGTPIHTALPPHALPNETFYDTHAIPFGAGAARASYVLQAHTDGDILLHFPEENVIAAGGVLKTDGWAEIDSWTGGWLGAGPARALNNVLIPTYGGMIGGLQALLEMADDDTIIVPASGPVADKAEVQAQFEMYAAIADRLREGLFSALSPEEMAAEAPAAGMRPEWGSPDAFVMMAFRSLWPHLTPDA